MPEGIIILITSYLTLCAWCMCLIILVAKELKFKSGTLIHLSVPFVFLTSFYFTINAYVFNESYSTDLFAYMFYVGFLLQVFYGYYLRRKYLRLQTTKEPKALFAFEKLLLLISAIPFFLYTMILIMSDHFSFHFI